MPTVANITAATTVKASSGKVKSVSVIVAGTGAGTVNDCATAGAAAAANAYIGLPTQVGFGSFGPAGMQFAAGITVAPGTGQTIAIDFE